MEECGVSTRNTIIFEDSYIGRLGAFKSGARVVSIKNRNDLTIEKIADEINKQV